MVRKKHYRDMKMGIDSFDAKPSKLKPTFLNLFSDFLTETTDRHLLKDVQSQLNCSTLVNILKTFMAVSSDVIRSKVNSASFLSISIRADCYASKENSHFLKKETSKDISEMAFQFLKIICSESWVKEKCLKDVDQFNTNLLVSFSSFFTFDHLVAPAGFGF